MIGGLKKSVSSLALVAATGLFMGGAAFAGGSVGGDCCADLEERVAELEATTARKGNRKVSLTVYGQVNKAVVFSNEIDPASGAGDVAIVDNDISASRFGFTGKASITSDVYAGYKMEFEVGGDAEENDIEIRHNDVYIGSKTFGKFSIGHGDTASNEITEIDLSGTALAGGSLNLTGYATTGRELDNLDGDSRRERVRYDSPTLAGFQVSASWQDNEDYDIALRFGSKLGDFTVAAGVAYLNEEESATDPDDGTETVSGSASVLHVPTGLNVTFAAGERDFLVDSTLEYWYVKAGIKRKVFGVGATAFSVDYHAEEQGGIEVDKVGFQLVQSIDAAAMELYIAGWSTESDIPSEDEDAIMIGSRIKF